MPTPATTRTLRFHSFGEPADVLHLERAEAPEPGPGRLRVRVIACGVNPADWWLCRGLFPGELPRGVGLEVSGTVEALGDRVDGVRVGDLVLGTPDWSRLPSAGAADLAVLEHWAPVPDGLGAQQAAALPMAAETAHRSLDLLGVRDHDAAGGSAGDPQVVLVHGAGTTVGFAAVQIALTRGARVLATVGSTYAGRLRALGAEVTAYGEGMVERVLGLAGGPVDLVLDTAPVSGVLPDLVRCAGGAADHVVTASDHETARSIGARSNLDGGGEPRYDLLEQYATLAAQDRFTVPIARTFALQDWHSAMESSLSGRAGGKLLLLP